MDTPILDFVTEYMNGDPLRLHMPGHKGLGEMEKRDITEIDGADSLYEAKGIIAQSEQNASRLFGHPTFYSTEGSSQCIRAMLYLAMLYAKQEGKAPLVLSGRNAHKTFINGAALLDMEVQWLYPTDGSYLCCQFTAEQLEKSLQQYHPAAVYLTSPDYLGNTADIQRAAQVCHQYGALLLVDNAHGAYLHFLTPSLHPMDLGADLCCASAHKTLPTLTGGAYLHVREEFAPLAKTALSLFGSTSPSYLILQSLDQTNAYLAEGYKEKLAAFVGKTEELKHRLAEGGYVFAGQEPLKLTLCTKAYGYEGEAFGALLQQQGITPEFSDPDHVVLMLTPELTDGQLMRLEQALFSIEKKWEILTPPPPVGRRERALSLRQAVLSVSEMLPVEESVGRVAATADAGCPPAVSIVVSGERIDRAAAEAFRYYGITRIRVVAESTVR